MPSLVPRNGRLRVRLVIFDLGGTTIRDRGEVPAAFVEALTASGIRFEPEEFDGWRGASKREVVARLAERQEADDDRARVLAERTYRTFRSTLRARFASATDVAFPAALPAFQELQAAGVKLALNSGFDRDIVDLLIASAAWPADLFAAVVCSEDVSEGRPAPDMIFLSMHLAGVEDAADVAVVGDTSLDMEAGERAGVACRIAVLSGAHERAILESSPCTHIVADVSAVPVLVA